MNLEIKYHGIPILINHDTSLLVSKFPLPIIIRNGLYTGEPFYDDEWEIGLYGMKKENKMEVFGISIILKPVGKEGREYLDTFYDRLDNKEELLDLEKRAKEIYLTKRIEEIKK